MPFRGHQNPSLLAFNIEGDQSIHEVKDQTIVQFGSAPILYKTLSAQFLTNIKVFEADPTRMLVSALAIIQSYGIHDYLIPHGIGGCFVGLSVDHNQIRWQPDVLYVLHRNLDPHLSMISSIVRAHVLVVRSNLTHKCLYLGDSLNAGLNDEWRRRWWDAAFAFTQQARFDFVVLLNTAARVITVVEMLRQRESEYFRIDSSPQEDIEKAFRINMAMSPVVSQAVIRRTPDRQDGSVPFSFNWFPFSPGKTLEMDETHGNLEGIAGQYNKLGNQIRIRGDLNGAEAMYRRGLSIFEKLRHLDGIAQSYNDLGTILIIRGDLDGAEAMFRKALEINERLRRFERTASQYGNLGVAMLTRGDLDEAETMFRKALQIEDKHGDSEGIASQYGNLGNLIRIRGDLDGAETMYRNALTIFEKLGRLEGMAETYNNVGIIMAIRGDLNEAESVFRKAMEINEMLGSVEGLANQYGNLANVMRDRGDLEQAEKLYHRALQFHEKLGRLEGMAVNYGNLGTVMLARRNLEAAEHLYRKAMEIDERLGRYEGMANQYTNLGEVMEARGDLEAAREMWTRSCELFAKLGAQEMVERVQSCIDKLPECARTDTTT